MDNSDNPTKKDRAWLLPDLQKRQIRPGLYLVPTPIGHLSDMTIRALDVLNMADVVVCEDTRITAKLLKAYGLHKTLIAYNDHNGEKQRPKILKHLEAGEVVAQVSDAGTPMISDPGFRLVDMAIQQGIYTTALPGPNAPLTALLLSGFASDNFTFIGFLPTKTGARKDVLEKWKTVPSTLIAFESAKRLIKTLADIDSVMEGRPVAVVREISKMYEETRRGSAADLLVHYEKHGEPKGEITLVVSPGEAENPTLEDFEQEIRKALGKTSAKDISADVAARSGLKKKDVYEYVLRLSGKK